MTLAAMRASGRPVAFDTNGEVRDARGFTSRTYTVEDRVSGSPGNGTSPSIFTAN